MRAVVQRASAASVEVGEERLATIGDTHRGNRPSFVAAAPPDEARRLYERVLEALGAQGGRFGAHMRVRLVNDGPATLLIES